MPQSLRAFSQQLVAVLAADEPLQGYFGKAMPVVEGAEEGPLEDFEGDVPAILVDFGAGEAEVQVGGERSRQETDIGVFVLWDEGKPDRALAQRLELPDLVIRAVMRKPTLNGAVGNAWVAGFAYEPLKRPRHVLTVAVRAQYTLAP